MYDDELLLKFTKDTTFNLKSIDFSYYKFITSRSNEMLYEKNILIKCCE